MRFFKQAGLAIAVVVVGVGGLWALGRSSDGAASSSGAASSAAKPSGVEPALGSPDGAVKAPTAGPLVEARAVRDLVPPDAWLVADFQGDLSGQPPFFDQPGLCASVPAPERVAIALLPPGSGNHPDLLIAARKVEDTFWGCARDRIVRAGGTALAQNEQYEVLKSPSGVVARGPLGSMVFLTSETHLETALSVLSDLAPGAGTSGVHAGLFQRMYSAGGRPEDSVLDVTLSLPPDWLTSVGQEKDKTPLRFIRSAFLSAREDGSAFGGVDCEEAGCAEVLAFMTRAKIDLTRGLPPSVASTIEASLELKHVVGAGRIAISWTAVGTPLGQLLGRFLGPAMLGN